MLFRMVPSPTPSGLLFLKIGIRNPTHNCNINIISGMLKAKSHMELYLAEYTLRKREIKMQRNFYTPKLPN